MVLALTKIGSLVKVVVNDDLAVIGKLDDKHKFQYTEDNKVITPYTGYDQLALSDFTLNGEVPTTIQEFEDLLAEVFPSANAGNGGSGIDDVLAEEQSLTTERSINIGVHPLKVLSGEKLLLTIDPDSGSSILYSRNTEVVNNSAFLQAFTSAEFSDAEFGAVFDGDNTSKEANIIAHAEAGTSSLEHTADNHQFNNIQEFADNAAALLGDLEPGMLYYRTGHGLDIVIEED